MCRFFCVRRALLLSSILLLAGCGIFGKPKPTVPPPSPYPIDFPLILKWQWRSQGSIVGRVVSDGERLYVTTSKGYCYAVDPKIGAAVWMFKALHGFPTHPLLAADKLIIFSAEDEYYELKPGTGEVLYSQMKFGSPSGEGVLAGDLLYFASGQTQLRCYSIKDHKHVWKFAAEGRIGSDPAIAGEKLFVGDLSGNLYCLATADGHQLWKFSDAGEIHGRPAVLRDILVFGSTDNFIYAVNRAKGTLAWRIRTEADVVAPAAVAVHDGSERVFIGGFDDFLYCLKTNGHWVYRTTIPARMYGDFLIFDHMIVVASFSNRMVALDPKDGRSIGQIDLGSESRATPLIADRTLFTVTYDSETEEGIMSAWITQPPPPPQTQPAPQSQPASQSQPLAKPPAGAQSQPATAAKPQTQK